MCGLCINRPSAASSGCFPGPEGIEISACSTRESALFRRSKSAEKRGGRRARSRARRHIIQSPSVRNLSERASERARKGKGKLVIFTRPSSTLVHSSGLIPLVFRNRISTAKQPCTEQVGRVASGACSLSSIIVRRTPFPRVLSSCAQSAKIPFYQIPVPVRRCKRARELPLGLCSLRTSVRERPRLQYCSIPCSDFSSSYDLHQPLWPTPSSWPYDPPNSCSRILILSSDTPATA